MILLKIFPIIYRKK